MLLKDSVEKNRKKGYESSLYGLFESMIDAGFSDVLDVGCGRGTWSLIGASKKKFKNVYACDIFDDYQRDEIKNVSESVLYQQIENNIFPFQDNFFDLVFSMDVIEHVDDDVAFLSEKIRVAKSGGKIIIGTPNYSRIGNLPLLMTGKLKYPRVLGKDTYGDIIHLREYRKKDLLKLLNKFEDKIDQKSIRIIPCYLGVPLIRIGITKAPSILQNFSQYWLVEFIKK